MLLILSLLSIFLIGGVDAGILDLNCTHMVAGSPKYSQSAVNCNNKISDAACLVIYTDAVKADDDTERNAKCAGNPVNPQLVQAAIDICPKTCGYCCLTPAFMCENKLQPRVPCSSVTEDMCENAYWKPILEQDCPKTCGLCNAGSCVDEAPGCGLDNAFICQSKNLQSFVQKYCKRTCGLCNNATTTTVPPGQINPFTPGAGGAGAGCGMNPNCQNWARNGFCTSTFYSAAQKRQYCGRACGLC
uniref:ShKT domain-containing protein n=1 Tax=Haemonchus contortus TaxID=6289 RepID=A0A7I4Y0I4_HAECO|nr:Metridin ShK toxin domain containing protein [Haemonchus contortus]